MAWHLPDLIICDIQMPNLDGYGTLAALQQDAVTATIPFVFLTGLTDRTQIRQGMGLGADDYLTKPFTVGELMSAVNSRLAKRAAVQRRSEKKLQDLRGNIGLALPHEMLTPLNGILGFTSLMMEEGMEFEPHEIRDFARDIHTSALRLHRLIENFIIYSETELIASDPGKTEELRKCEPIFTAETVRKAATDKAASLGRERDLSLRVKEAKAVMLSGYFKKSIDELIDNAFKFSKSGSPVTVVSGPANDRFVFSIGDRGRGMTAAQIADVGAHMQFERRFYEQQGVGLGLIIAKRLAELHGGELNIESTPGEQSLVQLSLPLASTSA
jgi:two-component system sensor histidine kinase/response regulator